MTIVSEIIHDAYRESDLIPISSSPSVQEEKEALRLLNRLVKATMGNELGDDFKPVSIEGGSYQDSFKKGMPLNCRLLITPNSPPIYHLPSHPQDGARISILDKGRNFATNPISLRSSIRTVQGLPGVLLNTTNFEGEWFYRDDIGDWVKVSHLLLEDEFPFPYEFDDFFIVALAMRLNPRHGVSVDPQSEKMYRDGLRKFRTRFRTRKEVGSELGLIMLTQPVFIAYRVPSSYSSTPIDDPHVVLGDLDWSPFLFDWFNESNNNYG